jgi:amidohydrolase
MLLPDLDRRLDELLARLCALRHDLHRHPELGFQEKRTQGVVRAFLEEHGYAPRDCAETGLIAELRGVRAGRTIVLRADLDALPIDEETDLPHRSVHPGVAHKCGHDGHVAILLGAAALLAGGRERLAGSVRLLFQPAEEGVRGGGAKVMIREGALEGAHEAYALHNWPGFPLGEVRVREGPVMAQVDNFEIVVRGRGGHGGLPQKCRDPIVAGAHVVHALQSVVARGVGSRGPAVVTVGAFQAGTTHNVVPGRAHLRGTVRTFDPALREDLLAQLAQAVQETARAHRTEAEWLLIPEYPVLCNAGECAAAVARVAERVVGAERVNGDELPLAAAEDFAFVAQRVPSAYFFLGAGDPVDGTPGCHHPDFDFDDRLLPTGVRMMVGLVEARAGGG